ncbi:IclR family transcriptional regulator domain-containing protein [Microbacterium hydrothermale]|uniref:IclR family transcriptional regulator domain-containing protein n=1 Tax=Microbacterium hydrothermale TaxID=857427 RepID=UPI0010A80D76|nr:IclR family transcriptional regulator C-terminal domain-containing protein [Microbacterium hydrothermale]
MTPPASLTQGLSLLDAAIERERSGRAGFALARLAEAAGVERSRASRVTQELRRLAFIERDATTVLHAGPAFFDAAGARHEPWLRAARMHLRALAAHLGMIARVVAADGQRALLLRIEGAGASGEGTLRPAAVTPVWCTGAGRALLWDHSRAALDTLLRDAQFVGVGGPAAARTVDAVDALLQRDRERGLIIARSEYVAGLDEFALPVRGAHGIVAALSVSGAPVSAARERHIETLLSQSAERLSSLARG